MPFIALVWFIILNWIVNIFVENIIFLQKIFCAQVRFAEIDIFFAALAHFKFCVKRLIPHSNIKEYVSMLSFLGMVYEPKYLSS